MAKFLYLYRGGNVPEDLRDQNMKDWMGWIESLQKSGKLVDVGAPLDEGRVIKNDGSSEAFKWDGANSGVGGWSVVEVSDIDEAVSLTKGCPQLDPKYGDGSIEVRPIIPVPGM